jgi:hypothetical protein
MRTLLIWGLVSAFAAVSAHGQATSDAKMNRRAARAERQLAVTHQETLQSRLQLLQPPRDVPDTVRPSHTCDQGNVNDCVTINLK